jgi:wyosine [tRNA(Phe)-imidazoG37] synthetase (radical SAM superfamily)
MRLVKLRTFIGMMSDGLAFCGPRSGQIGVSQICNIGCLICPVFSPLVQNPEKKEKDPAFLSFKTFQEVVLELHKLGTKKILIIGIGEPLLNPEIVKMVKLVSSLGMECVLITSGIHLTEKMAEELAMPNVRFWISLHGGTQDVWCKVHPKHTADAFYRLKRCVAIISKSGKAKVILH